MKVLFFDATSRSISAVNPTIRFVNHLAEENFTYQQLVVHSLDDDFLGCVLRNVEAQLQHLAVTLVLDEGTVEAVQPGMIMLRTQVTAAVLSGLLRGGAAIEKRESGYRRVIGAPIV